MLEDIRRNHDPLPTPEERRWMSADPLGAVLRVAALATVAFCIGAFAAAGAGEAPAAPMVAVAGR